MNQENSPVVQMKPLLCNYCQMRRKLTCGYIHGEAAKKYWSIRLKRQNVLNWQLSRTFHVDGTGLIVVDHACLAIFFFCYLRSNLRYLTNIACDLACFLSVIIDTNYKEVTGVFKITVFVLYKMERDWVRWMTETSCAVSGS